MLALVCSDQLFRTLVSKIHHGQRKTYYESLLDDTSAATGDLPELPGEAPAQQHMVLELEAESNILQIHDQPEAEARERKARINLPRHRLVEAPDDDPAAEDFTSGEEGTSLEGGIKSFERAV